MTICFLNVFYNYICLFGIGVLLVIVCVIQNFLFIDFVQISTIIAVLINTGGL